MGTLNKRSRPFIGTLTTLNKAHPSVVSATVAFRETDFGNDPHERWHDLADDSRAACGNPRCQQGGYNFEPLLWGMVPDRIESKTLSMHCGGHEGSPKGRRRGRDCDMSLEGTITIKYKKLEESLRI
jgi:hypothetical protein